LIAILGNPDDERVPEVARTSLAPLVYQFGLVNGQVLENDRRVRASARSTELGRRLMEVPGVGPVLSSAMVATVPDPTVFKSGRNLAAWIGLVPRQNSSGGKEKLGGITKQGDRYLRQLLVAGALAVIRYVQRHGTKRPWLVHLLARRSPKIAAVALANKMARMIWPMMMTGERYREPVVAAAQPAAPGRVWKGNRDIMRSKPRTGKPICAKAPRARAFDRDPSQRKALWPAASVCRTNRPHTWPHRPKDRTSKIALPTESRPHMAQSGHSKVELGRLVAMVAHQDG
jgi:Transposase IS116/IS110/IS902 family